MAAPVPLRDPLEAGVQTALTELLGPPEPATVGTATRLTIYRTSPEDCRDRQVIFSLDGERIAELLYGQTHTMEIQPGPHKLRANNTLVWKTAEFIAPAGSHVHFTCVNWAPGIAFYMLAMFGVAPLFVKLRPGTPQFGSG